jgi:hypothetical protein
MPAESAALTSETPAPKRRNHRRARARFDKRYAIGRRVKQLMAIFRDRLGPDADDPVTNAAVMRCAEVTALAEVTRGKMLRGERVSTETVLRLSRTADLLTRKLGLDRAKPRELALPDPLEYARERAP